MVNITQGDLSIFSSNLNTLYIFQHWKIFQQQSYMQFKKKPNCLLSNCRHLGHFNIWHFSIFELIIFRKYRLGVFHQVSRSRSTIFQSKSDSENKNWITLFLAWEFWQLEFAKVLLLVLTLFRYSSSSFSWIVDKISSTKVSFLHFFVSNVVDFYERFGFLHATHDSPRMPKGYY